MITMIPLRETVKSFGETFIHTLITRVSFPVRLLGAHSEPRASAHAGVLFVVSRFQLSADACNSNTKTQLGSTNNLFFGNKIEDWIHKNLYFFLEVNVWIIVEFDKRYTFTRTAILSAITNYLIQILNIKQINDWIVKFILSNCRGVLTTPQPPSWVGFCCIWLQAAGWTQLEPTDTNFSLHHQS